MHTFMVNSTPNQIGSIPASTMIGKKIGMERTVIAAPSINIAMTNTVNIIMISRIMLPYPFPIPCSISERASCTPIAFNRVENKLPPIKSHITMQVILIEDLPARKRFSKVSLRFMAAQHNRPECPSRCSFGRGRSPRVDASHYKYYKSNGQEN